MLTRPPKSMHMPLMIAAIAAILFTAVAMASLPIMGWLHASFKSIDRIFAQERTPEAALSAATSGAGQARVKARCDECGVIDSMRRIDAVGDTPASYETTIRFGDGSTRVLRDASPPNWRPGERINLIGGGDPSAG